jgi:integrase
MLVAQHRPCRVPLLAQDRHRSRQPDLGGKVIDIHGLRGTCASRLVRNRVPVAVTQRILGHASPTMTMKHYVHLDVEDLREAVEGARPERPTDGEGTHHAHQRARGA